MWERWEARGLLWRVLLEISQPPFPGRNERRQRASSLSPPDLPWVAPDNLVEAVSAFPTSKLVPHQCVTLFAPRTILSPYWHRPKISAGVSWGSRNKWPQTRGLKQWERTFSPFWRPDIWDQCVGKVGSSGGSRGESVPGLSPSFRRLPAILGIPCFVEVSPPSLPQLSHGLLPCVCFYGSSFLIIRTPWI